MRKSIVFVVVAVVMLSFTGCSSLELFLKPFSAPSAKTAVAKGETGSVQGRLVKNKNDYVLTDASGVAYRFVGLKKDEESQLAPYVGKTVTVKLSVKSDESEKARNAQFIEIVK